MRNIILTLVFMAALQDAFGQRYLKRVFPRVDSVVDVHYGSAPNYKGVAESLYFDSYEPHGDHSTKRPLLIYAHGGGFTGGTRKWPSIKMICQKMAGRGYAVASISYRVDPRFNYLKCDTNRKVMTDAMHDMRAAIRFFKAHRTKYGIDTSHIFITGESAGAITAMMAGYVDQQNELKAYPMTDPDNVEGSSGTPGYSSGVQAVLCLCGMIYDTTAIASAKDDPLLWVHGSADPLIPFSWASEVPERAAHVGLRYQKIVFSGATHCPWYYGLPHWRLYLDSTVNDMAHFMYPLITGKTAPALAKAPPPLQLAGVLQSNMVIQQDKPFKLWGSSKPGDTIRISADWLKSPIAVYAGKSGEWHGEIRVPKAVPGNFDLHVIKVIDREDTIKLRNLLIGEVWICAGQSNMDMRVKEVPGWYRGVLHYKKEIAAADYPAIRVFTEATRFSVEPQDQCRGQWKLCSPETAGDFSAVAYYFGRALFGKLNVPVGLVVVAEAGASCQAFTEKNVLLTDTLLKRLYWDPYKTFVKSQARVDSLGFFTKVTRPMLIYNGMIHPLEKLSIRGFIWYQGASNYTDKGNYTLLCSAMLRSWRKNFDQGALPFYFVQIAPFAHNMDKRPAISAFFREAQQGLLKIKNTGMAVTMDVGDTANIHPRNKKPVGERLAKLALSKTYRYRNIVYRGPVYEKFTTDHGTVKISFEPGSIGDGLSTNDGQPPRCFYLAGADRVFHQATARIVGNQVWASSKEVPDPVAVRYGFTSDAVTHFENKDGLPAVPFRTDHWDQ